MKIIYNKVVPFGKRFYAINLFGVLFSKGPCDARIINHEKIHTAQMREMLYIIFYIAYVLEWLVRLIINRSQYEAYRNISFEREAYAHENDMSYLSKRKHFAFLKFLRK